MRISDWSSDVCSSDLRVPDRPCDFRVSLPTRPDQALIYRLSGDYNPLHIDPEIALQAGFERPILHGLCTYGVAGRALLRGLVDADPLRLQSMSCRSEERRVGKECVSTGKSRWW